MDKRCAPSRIVTHDDLILCEEACEPSLCCFYNDVSGCWEGANANGDLTPKECDEFEFCRPLAPNIYYSRDGVGGAFGTSGYGENGTGKTGGEFHEQKGNVVVETNDPQYGVDHKAEEEEDNEGPPNTFDYVSESQYSQGQHEDNNKGSGGSGSVGEMCSFDRVVGGGQELSQCMELCSNHFCCFDNSEAMGCMGNPDCDEYQSCEILINFDLNSSEGWGQSTAKDTREEVNTACDIGKMTGDRDSGACRSLCYPHRCCFTGECPSRDEVCLQYEACVIMFSSSGDGIQGGRDRDRDRQGLDWDEEEEEEGDLAAHLDLLNPPADLDQVCAAATIDDDDNDFLCREGCLMALCCRGMAGDCSKSYNFCRKFSSCNIVWDDQSEESTTT